MRKTLSKERLRKFKVLQAGFDRKLGPRIADLSALVDQLGQLTEADQEITFSLIKKFLYLSHQLAGSAGNFGYPEISEKSKRFESLSKAVLLGKESYSHQCRRAFPELITEILKRSKLPPLSPELESSHQSVNVTPVQSEQLKRMLIVDDDVVLTELLTLQLSQYGYQVRCIHDPRNIDTELASHSPDIVLMDIGFPGEENLGFSIVSRLRKQGSLECPLVFVSGRGDIQARLGSAKANADGYLVKPVNLHEAVNLFDYLIKFRQTKFRIMLVDEDDTILDLYVGKLQQTGFVTKKVTDPFSTLQELDQFRPDVILLDSEMRCCSGLDLARVIRQIPENLQIPIVFLKSRDKAMYKGYSFYCAGDDVIDKPVNPGELVAVMRARAQRARDILNLQAQLKNSEARLRGFSQMAGSAVVVSDQDERIVFWNPAAEELFGYENEEILGQRIAMLVPASTRAEQQRAYAKILGLPAKSSKRLLTGTALVKSGKEIPVEVSLGSWRTQGQVYISAIITDITHRQLIEQQLQQAKAAAEKANLAKSEFLSSMSHELRTPLNAILGFGQMLKLNNKGSLTKTEEDCVKYILIGGDHLLALIDEILDLAKVEAGKVEFHFEDVGVSALLNECVAQLASLTGELGIQVRYKPAAHAVVRADYTRLKQVILNLLSNAIKYNRNGGKVIISCSQSGTSNLRVSISDTGFGIPKSKQHELFQPFSRLGKEFTKLEGTGIGLVVTKQLVELMGGAVGFESEENTGSTFWAEIPLAQTNVKIDTDTTDQILQAPLPKIGGTLLYIEDNTANLALMKMLVAGIDGLRLISAQNAELGIELARSERPNIVILDIHLPGMNGFEALEKLQSNPQTSDIPVIALSASASQQEKELGLNAGFVKYLTKPMQVESVVAAIRAIIDPVEARGADIH